LAPPPRARPIGAGPRARAAPRGRPRARPPRRPPPLPGRGRRGPSTSARPPRRARRRSTRAPAPAGARPPNAAPRPATRARSGGEESARQELEVPVALGLDREHRLVPAVLARLDDLVVPVGALDQADDERPRAWGGARPGEDLVEQLRRVAQVGL